MPLKLMYITNRAEIAEIAQANGVDRIFIDMEYIGKSIRQGGMDTVQSHHTTEDVRTVRKVLDKSQLLVRCNPIHESTAEYCSSKEEIDDTVGSGADIIMLPYFKTVSEVEKFVGYVDGRCRTMLLVETPEAAEKIDDILNVGGIDEIHIGLNDLSLGLGKKFMFEILAEGMVDRLCDKIRNRVSSFGFGGIAALGKGAVPAEMVIREHYRLGSKCAILSRSFCDAGKIPDINEVSRIFETGLCKIRALEKECESADAGYFDKNRKEFIAAVNAFVAGLEK